MTYAYYTYEKEWYNMGILEEIEKVISRMRQELYEIIDNKENLLDIDVINASQKLDSMLNIYNELLKNK